MYKIKVSDKIIFYILSGLKRDRQVPIWKLAVVAYELL